MGLEPLIKAWGLLHRQYKIIIKSDSDQQVLCGIRDSLKLLPDWADDVDEIEPCWIGHDLWRCGSCGDGCTHGGQGNGHDGQRLA